MIQVTKASGTTTPSGPSMGSWTNMGSARRWYINNQNQFTIYATLNYQIRIASNQQVVSSGTIRMNCGRGDAA